MDHDERVNELEKTRIAYQKLKDGGWYSDRRLEESFFHNFGPTFDKETLEAFRQAEGARREQMFEAQFEREWQRARKNNMNPAKKSNVGNPTYSTPQNSSPPVGWPKRLIFPLFCINVVGISAIWWMVRKQARVRFTAE